MLKFVNIFIKYHKIISKNIYLYFMETDIELMGNGITAATKGLKRQNLGA